MYISEVLDTSLEERYAFFSDFLFDLYLNALTFDYVACSGFGENKTTINDDIYAHKMLSFTPFWLSKMLVIVVNIRNKMLNKR